MGITVKPCAWVTAEVMVSQGRQEPLPELHRVSQDPFCSKHTCHVGSTSCRVGRQASGQGVDTWPAHGLALFSWQLWDLTVLLNITTLIVSAQLYFAEPMRPGPHR